MTSSTSITDHVATYQQLLYTFCYRSLGHEGHARTLVRRVFEEAWSLGNQEVSRDEAIQLLRIAYRLVTKALPSTPSGHRTVGAGLPGVGRDGRQADIQVLLNVLPAPDRCLVVLRCCCALTVEEIGTISGLPSQDVRVLLVRACSALAPLLLPLAQPLYEHVWDAFPEPALAATAF
jgi:DNA-directed RNA polymerase specialized sigma24 family protein